MHTGDEKILDGGLSARASAVYSGALALQVGALELRVGARVRARIGE